MNSNSHHPQDLCLVSPNHEFARSAMEGHTNLSQSDRLLVLDTQGSCDQFGPRDSRGKEIILRLELFSFLGDRYQIFQLEKVGRGILNANGLWQGEWLSGRHRNTLLCPLMMREGGKISALSGRFIFLGQVFFEVCRWQFHLHLMSFRLFPFCCAKHLSQLGLIWWGHAVTLDPLDLKWNHLTRKGREHS